MPANWPTTLPQYVLQDNFKETPVDQVIRAQPDFGGVKMRRRFTAKFINMTWTMQMSNSQVAIFEDFFFNILKAGSLTFNAPHPRTRTTTTFKIKGTYDISAVSGDIFRVTFNVEAQP